MIEFLQPPAQTFLGLSSVPPHERSWGGERMTREQGWRSGVSVRFPDPASYVDWVCCWFSTLLRGFSPGSPVFLPPQKPTFLNSNSIGNSRTTGLSVEDCCVSPSLNKVDLFIYFIYLIKGLVQTLNANLGFMNTFSHILQKITLNSK